MQDNINEAEETLNETPETEETAEAAGQACEAQETEEMCGEGAQTEPECEEKESLKSRKEKKKFEAERKAFEDTIKKKDTEILDLKDRVVRGVAEFDNYRKRTETEKSQMFDVGAGSVIEKLLPVVDDIERGLAALTEEEKQTSYAQGMDMIYKKLMKTLEDMGVKPIEAVGKEFDPEFHNAVMQAASTECETGFVTGELQKGYTYKDKIIRHSMVIVAE